MPRVLLLPEPVPDAPAWETMYGPCATSVQGLRILRQLASLLPQLLPHSALHEC